jgi:hypothetical protein
MPTLALLQVRSLLTLVQVNICAPIAIGSPSDIVLGDDSTLICSQEGTIELPVQTEKGTYTLSLTNALLAPQLRNTLISCSALSFSGISTYFAGPYCSLYGTLSPGAPFLAARCTEKDYCIACLHPCSPRRTLVLSSVIYAPMGRDHACAFFHCENSSRRYVGCSDVASSARTHRCRQGAGHDSPRRAPQRLQSTPAVLGLHG